MVSVPTKFPVQDSWHWLPTLLAEQVDAANFVYWEPTLKPENGSPEKLVGHATPWLDSDKHAKLVDGHACWQMPLGHAPHFVFAVTVH